ncbi:hypothetical protein K4F52_003016 [Lecanicillium sp. MT-2017a]|nr:hypothetical protein K4F52_003016 [Lecanicillium sp. MT-2017a]
MHFTSTALFLSLTSLSTALIHGVDSSAAVPVDTFKKALGQGFVKAIPRGYFEACNSGGLVDPNFASSYKNAVAAGYKDIDTYMFPCTGTTNKCKPYAEQIKGLLDAIAADKMNIGTIWVDIESDDKVCHAWDYGAKGNLAEAKKLIEAVRATKRKFGIYSSPGEWEKVFGSRDVEVDKSVPLWFATFDNVETLDMKTPFGGWTKAAGKQYTDKSASGKFDLNVFA